MYIRATANISPQSSFNQLLENPAAYNGDRLACIEPDYAKLIDPKMIRRMSRIIKMGVAAAIECLKEADIQMPGAIITGTAYGCLADTDLFLSKMVENKEELLTPTSFIQSTHNTVGAQIALILKCHNYNNTFVHRGFSFESALLDAITCTKDQQASDVLVGAADEITNTSHAILSRFGLYKNNLAASLDLFKTESKGTIAGEGSAFFLLTDQPSSNDYAELRALHTFYKPADFEEIRKNISSFLSSQSVSIHDIDLVITGRNGDIKNDKVYRELQQSLFQEKTKIDYKHLCGEYPTSSAFALWLAANILKYKTIPGLSQKKYPDKKLKNILIYNHYQGIHHSLYLLSAC
jgi:3-oxoacyl-[acyl-carrier-protein] synthase II